MKSMNTKLKRLFANAVCIGLLCQSILPYSVYAQEFDQSAFDSDFEKVKRETQDGSNSGYKDIMSGISGVGSAVDQYMKVRQQMNQAQQQQVEMQKLQMTLTPKVSPDDYFPQCKVLPSKADKVAGLCESPLSGDNELMEAMAAYQAAKQNANLYENHLTMGNKAGDDQGIQCIKENAAMLRTQLYERLKQVDDLKREMAEHKAAFELGIQQDENNLKEINGLLTGEDGFEMTKENRDLSGIFADPACNAVADFQIGEGKKGMAGGLLGIRTKIEDKGVKESRELLTKKDSIVREFKRDLGEFVNNVTRELDNGSLRSVDAKTLRDKFGTRSVYGIAKDGNSELLKTVSRVADDFSNDQTELTNQLSEMGVPPQLQESVVGPNTNLERSLFVWERELKNECFKRKVTSNLDTFKSNARERNQNVRSKKNIDTFFNSISSILSTSDNPNLTMEQRIAEIKKRQDQYGFQSIAVNLNASVAGKSVNTQWNVADAFAAYGDDCTSEFNTQKNAKGFSAADIKSRVKAIQTEFKNNKKQLAMNLASKMQRTFLECEGVEYNNTPEDCSKSKMNPQGANFCLKQSLTCAQSISSCFAKADTIIKVKQEQQKQIARVVNKKIMDFKAAQYAILKKVEAQYKGTANLLKQYFPGTNFAIPFEISANPQNGEYSLKHGVQLLDTKNFTEDMDKNLEKVTEAIKKQNEEIVGTYEPGSGSVDNFGGIVGDKLKIIEENYKKQQTEWEKLASDCQTQMDSYIAAKNKAAEEQNKMAMEQNEKIRRFCSTIQTISSTPGCGKVSELTDTAFEIADEIGGLSAGDSQKLATLASYQAVCEASQSHDEENTDLTTLPDLDGLCAKDDYKKSKQCVAYKDFHKQCTDDYYNQTQLITEYNEIGKDKSTIETSCTPKVCQDDSKNDSVYTIPADGGKCYSNKSITVAKASLCNKFNKDPNKYPNNFKKIAMCGEDASEKTEKMIEIQEPLEKLAVSLDNNKKIKELRADVGEQSYQICNAQSTTPRSIAKEFGQSLEDMASFQTTAQDI